MYGQSRNVSLFIPLLKLINYFPVISFLAFDIGSEYICLMPLILNCFVEMYCNSTIFFFNHIKSWGSRSRCNLNQHKCHLWRLTLERGRYVCLGLCWITIQAKKFRIFVDCWWEREKNLWIWTIINRRHDFQIHYENGEMRYLSPVSNFIS